jgi:molecular chaperone DnaK (HSP70)
MVCHHDGETKKVRLDRHTGSILMPSAVLFFNGRRDDPTPPGIYVGSPAESKAFSEVAGLYPSTFSGHKPVKLGLDNPDFASIAFDGTTYDAFQMAVLIFEEMLEVANIQLGYRPDTAVLTHPAYFNHLQVKLIRDAAMEAGLFIPMMRAEPVAAALAWAVSERIEGFTAVYDFGGGTFDTTVLSVGQQEIQTYAKRGNPKLGGRLLTETVYETLLVPLAKEKGPWDLKLSNLTHDVAAQLTRDRLWQEAEKAKVRLSSDEHFTGEVELPLDKDSTEIVNLQFSISRKDLEAKVLSLIRGATETVQEAIHDAGLMVKDIKHVLPVGGVTRMPLIRQELVALFGESRVHQPADPDTLAAHGAALVADGVTAAKININDVLARSLRRRIPKSTQTKVLIGRGKPLGKEASVVMKLGWPGGQAKEVGFDLCEGEHEDFAFNEPVGTVLIRPDQPLPPKTPLELTLWYDESISAFNARTNLATVKVAIEPLHEDSIAALAPEVTAVKMADVFLCLDVSRSFRNSLLPLVTRECLNLEEQLRRANIDCRFSVLAFADPAVPGEEILAHNCTAEGSLRSWLSNLPQYDGGDTSEDIPALLLRLIMELAVSRDEAQKLILLFTDAPTKSPGSLPPLMPRLQANGAAIFVFAPMMLPGTSFQFYEDLAFATGGQHVDVHTGLSEGFQKALGLLGLGAMTGGAPA